MARLSQGAGKDPRALSLLGLKRAFGYALEGLAYAWRTGPNFRLEVAIGAVAVLLGLGLGVNLAPVLLAVGLVLGLELLNTALEAALDLLAPNPHPLAKAAKDTAAAAVLVASLAALLLGLYLFLPPLLRILAR